MKIALRRFLRLAVISTFLAILASPLAAPRLALGSSLTPPQSNQPCSDTFIAGGGPSYAGVGPSYAGIGLSYDADSQRCVFGGGGCDFQH